MLGRGVWVFVTRKKQAALEKNVFHHLAIGIRKCIDDIEMVFVRCDVKRAGPGFALPLGLIKEGRALFASDPD